VLAFKRSHESETLAVIVPRLVSHLMSEDGLVAGSGPWGNTALALPSGQWRDLLTGREIAAGRNAVPIEELLDLPIAVLRHIGK
jgi:maltooligosyltrehalose synthase